MPHVVVYGLTASDFAEDKIAKLEIALTNAFLLFTELKLRSHDISFSFVSDPSVTLEEIPIVIIVELLFDKPERTFELRKSLAFWLHKTFSATIRSWRKVSKVEVAVKRFDPEKDGFCTDPK
jgi:hypothetical protein